MLCLGVISPSVMKSAGHHAPESHAQIKGLSSPQPPLPIKVALAGALGLCGLMVYLMVADVSSPWFYYAGLPGRRWWFWLAWGGLLSGLLIWKKGTSRAMGIALSVVALGYLFRCVQVALRSLEGGVLYKTDHPSFMFRLAEFAQSFPALGGYSPAWNAGTEQFTGVSSGIQGIGLLLLPWLKFFPVHTLYNGWVLLLFLGLVPILAAASARWVGGDRAAMATAALLSLGVSHQYFLWMWHFGTLGAVFSAVMVMPVLALSYRVVVRKQRDPFTFVGLWLSMFLMSMWMPLALTVGAGLLVAYGLMRKHWDGQGFRFLALCATVFLISWSPWLRIILFPARGVVSYVGQPSDETYAMWHWGLKGGQGVFRMLADSNPLILLLGVAGIISPSVGPLKRWYIPSLLVLACFTGWVALWKPLSQFERLSLPMVFVLLVPASLYFARGLRDRGWGWVPVQVAGLALLLLSAEMAVRSYDNKGPAPAQTMEEVVPQMLSWIEDQVPEKGRLLFAGSAVHAYGGGKIAYLPLLAKREMMADDYFGFPQRTIEYNFPPRVYRKDSEKFRAYLEAYNVTHVITSHDKFRDYFASYPEDFIWQSTFSFREATLSGYRFVRHQPLMGEEVEIQAKVNAFQIDFPAEIHEAVISYNWREGLRCLTPGAEIAPFQVDENIRFIRVTRGDDTRVKLGYQTPWKPLALNFDGSFHH